MSVAILRCANPVSHGRVKIHTLQHHHVLPVSWGGADGEKVDICGTCHDQAHDLLNQFIHHGGKPPSTILRTYNKFIRDLCTKAWMASSPGKRPYTTSEGLMHP